MVAYHGKSGQLYMSTSGTGNASAVAFLNNWSLDLSVDTVETTSFGDTNKTYVQGLPNYTGSFSGFWNNAAETLFSAQESTDGVKLYLYPTTGITTKYWYGPAWVDVSLEVGVDAAITVSGNFVANGAWDRQWS